MARLKDIELLYEEALAIFKDRHPKYGVKMTKDQCLNMLDMKLTRLKSGSAANYHDSAVDLANYAMFLVLMDEGKWEIMD